MKKILKSILNTLVNLVEFIFGMVLLTGSLTITGVMIITTFIVYVPLYTIRDMIDGDSLTNAFVDNVEMFFGAYKEAIDEVSKWIGL